MDQHPGIQDELVLQKKKKKKKTRVKQLKILKIFFFFVKYLKKKLFIKKKEKKNNPQIYLHPLQFQNNCLSLSLCFNFLCWSGGNTGVIFRYLLKLMIII